jgi:hypothetical protein
MGRGVRDAAGSVLLACALAVLFVGVRELRERDYLASIVLVMTGMSLLKAGVELLRQAVGE